MTKDLKEYVNYCLKELKLSRWKSDGQIDILCQEQLVTRALEPTHRNSKDRETIFLNIAVLQKDLNRQKNLLTKISKALRNSNS